MTHINELKYRSLFILGAFIIGGTIGYLMFTTIVQWLTKPLGASLYYSSPAGSFEFIIKVSAMMAIGFALPVFVYHLASFIRPAVKESFRASKIFIITVCSTLLALAGAAFGFYLILPSALHFFNGFQVEGLSALISADSYLGLVTNVIVIFMVTFQLPLLLLVVDHISPLKPLSLFKAERWVILGALVVSLLMPFALDITTSLFISLPIIVLYNIAILAVIIRHKLTAKSKQAATVYQDIQISDELVAEYVQQATATQTVENQPAQTRGFAMEFRESHLESISDLRKRIEAERQIRIAQKVAAHNNKPVRVISEIS